MFPFFGVNRRDEAGPRLEKRLRLLFVDPHTKDRCKLTLRIDDVDDQLIFRSGHLLHIERDLEWMRFSAGPLVDGSGVRGAEILGSVALSDDIVHIPWECLRIDPKNIRRIT